MIRSNQSSFFVVQRAIRHSLLILFIGGAFTSSLAQDDAPWWKSLFNGKHDAINSPSNAKPFENEQMSGVQNGIQGQDSSESNGQINETASALEPISNSVKRQIGSYELQSNAHISALDSAWKVMRHPVQGYRVQLYLGTLQEARKVRSQMRLKTDLPIYLTSLAPSYRVTVGDFHDKWAAEKERQRWSETFRMTIVIPMEISISSAQGQQ